MLKDILIDIYKHNQKIYNSTPYNEKIDFSKTKKNWGTTIIPKEFWINKNKTYKTRNGMEVIIDNIVMKNSSGNEVTYPIKGFWLKKVVGKKDKWENAIWTLDGRISTTIIEAPLDLVEVK